MVAGLRLPIVYNTSSYDSLDSLRLMDGIVDIYLPDLEVPMLGLSAQQWPHTAGTRPG